MGEYQRSQEREREREREKKRGGLGKGVGDKAIAVLCTRDGRSTTKPEMVTSHSVIAAPVYFINVTVAWITLL